MSKLFTLLRWIDTNIVHVLLVAYIFFIPLYPKIPIRMIDYTYIAIRGDDLFVGVLIILFLIQLLRKKITLNTRFLKYFILFWVAIGLSYLWGAYVQKTIIYPHLGILHTARRVEYMIIFFIASSIIRSKKEFLMMLQFVLITAFLVAFYGIGQKYAGWPAVSTMNPEFAKGHILYLTPEARVSSTFAGHYDLAGYLVFLLPVMLGYYFVVHTVRWFFISATALFTLMLTASRVSYISFIASTFPFIVFARKWITLILFIAMTAGFTYLSQNLTSRWFQTVQIKQIFINEKTGQVVVPQKSTPKELPAGTFYIEIDKDKIPGDNSLPQNADQQAASKAQAQAQIIAELQSEASKEGRLLSASDAASMAASISAQLKPINTVVSDVSSAIRFQVTWPRAIDAFKNNPILGAGASAITESTDGDYFRWIGEFGALGTITFFLILGNISWYLWSNLRHIEKNERILYYGFLFGLGGLLVNAIMIDIFEASKVAYTFWLVAGLYVASIPFAIKLKKPRHEKN